MNSKEKALNDIAKLLDEEPNEKKRNLIAKWLSKYAAFLRQENTFRPELLKRYRRGEVIMANLGFRIGNEEGGPHYAIVLDKDNKVHSGVITVIPLSSKKSNYKENKYSLDLGNEIFECLDRKAAETFRNTFVVEQIENKVSEHTASATVSLYFKNDQFKRIREEIDQMKEGSVALISQLTTISKIRIIKPKRTTDPLSGVILSDDTLDRIDQAIMDLYIDKKQ